MVWNFKYVICWKMIQLSVSDWSYAERKRWRPRGHFFCEIYETKKNEAHVQGAPRADR